MSTTADLERQLLGLPPADRAKLLIRAWESLVEDPAATEDPEIDPQGLKLALERDADLQNGRNESINDAEFRRRTSADG